MTASGDRCVSTNLPVKAGAVWMWGWDALGCASPREERKALTGPGRGRRKHPNRSSVLLASFQKNRETRGTRDFTDTSPNTVPAPRFYSYISFYPQTGSTGHSDLKKGGARIPVDPGFNPKRAPQ